MKFKCPVCGEILNGQPDRCPKCGKKMKYPEQPQQAQQPVKPVEQQPVAPVAPAPTQSVGDGEIAKSYFDGGLLQLIGWTLLGALITLITIGICFPVALCMKYNWEVKHTVIEGRRLAFNGHAIQLVGNWIKWLLLSIITLFIFALWIPIKLKKWITKHTYFVD